jgi:2-hydroxy-4-carboxymuconate semialdehyde hemiacetal dehydrogenase
VGGVTFDSVVGRLPKPAAQFAQEYGFDFHTTELDAALARDTCEAVVVCSPSDLHAGQTEAALQAGKHVLCEIPLATNYPDAERVAFLAEAQGRTLMVAHTQRYIPALREAHRRIAAGEFHLEHLVCRWFFFRRENVNWTGRRRSWTDNLLWHHGCHVVDMALWMLETGDVEAVGHMSRTYEPLGIPLDLNISLRTRDGRVATIAMSYNAHWPRHDYVFIGREDTWLFEGGALRNAKGVLFESAESAAAAQNADFLAAVRGGTTPSLSGRAVLPAMRTLQRIQDENA